MTTTITPKGSSGVTNLPATSSSQGLIKDDTIPQDGMNWGAEVASDKQGDSSFNFDDYAQSTAAQMQGLGYGSTATAQYVNAMYAGYLAAGGDATGEAAGTLGASSNAEAGIYGALASGDLGLPGQGQEPPVAVSGQASMSLSPSTAGTIGANLATNAGVNYSQWRANMEGDLEDAGYSQDAVTKFMNQVDTAYYGANPNNIVNQGLTFGQTLTGFSSNTDMENYITNTLIPSLQSQGLSTDQVNQYVEGVRAGAYSGSASSNVVSMGLQEGQEVASYESVTPSFNFDTFAQSVATQIASPSSGLDTAQQAAYMSAMYAGYLRGGGVATQESTSVNTLSVNSGAGTANSSGAGTANSSGAGTANSSGAGTANSSGAGTANSSGAGTANSSGAGTANSSGAGAANSSGAGSSGTQAGPSVGTAPQWANQIYTAIAQAPSAAALSSDVANVQAAVAALSSAAQYEQQSPTSTHAANLQSQWQRARGAEAQFWSDLASTNDPLAASAGTVAQKFASDPHFTLEGEMPASYAAGAMPTAMSSAAVTLLQGLAASSGLGTGVSLPSNLAQIVANPNAISSMSQNDFTSTAEGLVALYQQNPSAYYTAIQSIHDPNLAGALNYAVQDMVTNGADSLVQNNASLTQENNTLAGYYKTALANPSTYSAWTPQAASPSGSASMGTGLAAIPASTSDLANITAFLNSTTFDGSSSAKYAEACSMMANLWKTNQTAYYQVLGGIPNQSLRNAVNAGVQQEFVSNPQDLNTDRSTADFQTIWGQVFGKTGPGASNPTFLDSHLNISTQTGGAT